MLNSTGSYQHCLYFSIQYKMDMDSPVKQHPITNIVASVQSCMQFFCDRSHFHVSPLCSVRSPEMESSNKLYVTNALITSGGTTTVAWRRMSVCCSSSGTPTPPRGVECVFTLRSMTKMRQSLPLESPLRPGVWCSSQTMNPTLARPWATLPTHWAETTHLWRTWRSKRKKLVLTRRTLLALMKMDKSKLFCFTPMNSNPIGDGKTTRFLQIHSWNERECEVRLLYERK